jgi:hypothetical protein
MTLHTMRRLLALALSTLPLLAQAWHAEGHQTVATIAAGLIQGTPTQARVKALLGDLTLADAAVWADCVKGVKPDRAYTYPAPGRYASCAPLETPERIAEMADYVRRNLRQCEPHPGEETCHQQYHYTDVALQRSRYIEGFAGTSGHDVVGVAQAAIRVLQGQPSTPPMDFKSPREALLVLVHAIGDMHEPMHVGTVYLDAHGRLLDPDKTGLDRDSLTIGGNALHVAGTPASGPGSLNLHSVWDRVPERFGPAHVDAAWLAEAARVAPAGGAPLQWPSLWATDSLDQARAAFDGLRFGPKQGKSWSVVLPAGYETRADAIKRQQLTRGGARLAQLLMAVLPAP